MFLRSRLLIALAVSACGGPDPVPLKIKFSLGTDPPYDCQFDSCSEYAMGCGATVGIRIIDPDETDLDRQVLASDCVFAPPPASAPSLCAIDDVREEIQLDRVPAGLVQVQVAIAAPPPEGQTPTCPDEMFRYNLNGTPQIVNPVPAFGGAVYVDDVGVQSLVDVKLACPDPGQVNEISCLSQAENVVVQIDDLKDVAFLGLGATAQSISVAAGEPVLDTAADPPVWTFKPGNSTPIDLVFDSAPARWEGQLEPESHFDAVGCVLVTPEVLGPITQVSCTTGYDRNPIDGHIEIKGLYLPDEDPEDSPGRDVFAQILDAAIASDVILAFPPQGLVIGRVVTSSGVPLADVTVTSSPSGHDVWYLVDDGAGNLIGADRTGTTRDNGYFLSLTPPFGTRWQASHPDGRTQNVAMDFQAGLIANRLSLVLIRMTSN